MDGVLVDGEPLHFAALNRLLAEDGFSITLEEYRPYMGTQAGWREFVADLGLPHPPEHYRARYGEVVLAEYREHSKPLPGATALVHALRRAGMRLGLCSSSVREWVDACLEAIGLAGQFHAMTTGDEIEHGKPAPDIYLETARRLDTPPAKCLAIEDAPAGIRAAHAAGMTCWAVRTEYTRDLELPGPDRVFDSLLEVDVADISGVPA